MLTTTVNSGASDSLLVVERARRYIAKLPESVSGQRGHDAAFRAACVLVHGFALSKDAAYALLVAEFNPRCQPPWESIELFHKIESALGAAHSKPRGYLLEDQGEASQLVPSAAPKWPPVDEERRQQIIAAGPNVAELCDRSPVVFNVDDSDNVARFLGLLFFTVAFPDPLLCIGKSSSQFATRRLSEWIDGDTLPGHSLIVPSPMSARTGRTKDGRESEHTLDNTGPRRFLVVEFDHGAIDEHAALLWHLSKFAPPTLVVHSGSKSLHGWYFCHGQTEESLKKFMNYAVSLGADRATWTRSQFVRLPSGRRENGALQRVLYCNPKAIQSEEVAGGK